MGAGKRCGRDARSSTCMRKAPSCPATPPPPGAPCTRARGAAGVSLPPRRSRYARTLARATRRALHDGDEVRRTLRRRCVCLCNPRGATQRRVTRCEATRLLVSFCVVPPRIASTAPRTVARAAAAAARRSQLPGCARLETSVSTDGIPVLTHRCAHVRPAPTLHAAPAAPAALPHKRRPPRPMVSLPRTAPRAAAATAARTPGTLAAPPRPPRPLPPPATPAPPPP